MKLFRTVDEFLSTLPKPVRERVEGLRKIIRQAAPRAEETISYNMPLIQAERNAGVVRRLQNTHCFQPKASAIAAFKKEQASYKISKGAIQFPMEAPVPADLVKKIAKFRLNENEEQKREKR